VDAVFREPTDRRTRFESRVAHHVFKVGKSDGTAVEGRKSSA